MLGFLRRLWGSSRAAGPPSSGDSFFLDVECERCGERFHLHINRATACVQVFDEPGVAWRLERQVIGSRCRSSMHVRIDIAPSGHITHREITNGRFIETDQA